MCFYNYTDSPSQSLFHAVHVEVFKDLLLKKGLRLSFPKESSDFYMEPLIMGHLMGFGVPTSSSLLCSKANSTVGTANWLAKKLTSPGNCEELTFGPGQFPPRMQLSSCLWDHREQRAHILALRKNCFGQAYNEENCQPTFTFWVIKHQPSGRSRETMADKRGRRKMKSLSRSSTRFPVTTVMSSSPLRVQPLSQRRVKHFAAVNFFFLSCVSPGATG